ncbi:MAG: glycosyltransferase [Microthrixaceae bacterium]
MPERTWNRFPDPSRPLDIGVYGARGIPSTYSGYETFLTLLLPELARRGDRVTMYCRSGEGFEGSDWQGVRRVVLPAVAGKNSSTLTHGAVAAMAARTARHDVVLVVNVANAAFCALGRYSGQPVVLNVDGQEWLRGKWGGVARYLPRLRGSHDAARTASSPTAPRWPTSTDVTSVPRPRSSPTASRPTAGHPMTRPRPGTGWNRADIC